MIVLARHLQQQPFDLVEAEQSVPRDRVRQPRPQHHELVLPLVLGSAIRPPHGIVQPPQLALGPRIHVPHAAHHAVRLVIQVQAVGNQFLELNLRWTKVTPLPVARIPPAVIPAARPVIPPRPSASAACPRPTILPRQPRLTIFHFLLLWHPLTLAQQTGPL